MNPFLAILDRIIAAQLPPATERIAMRILALTAWTSAGHGLCAIAWDEYATLCNRANRSSARRHLTTLAKAAIIRYRGGDVVYIQWLLDDETWDAQPSPCAADGDYQRLPERADAPDEAHFADMTSAGARAVPGANAPGKAHTGAAGGAPARHSSHTRAVGGGGDVNPSPRQDRVVNTTTNHAPEVDELLSEIGLSPRAVHIHRDLCVDDTFRTVYTWEKEAAEGEVRTGALIHRLRHGITPVVERYTLRDRVDRRKYEIPPELSRILIG